uniref:Uncharacterized protein n=1 Tax=Oryza sativa subsp. japonica TaxID=39947 RepID=Q6EPP5_ORYSJ|nr:hypothetical protein [Oryza sativa Japonica Group]
MPGRGERVGGGRQGGGGGCDAGESEGGGRSRMASMKLRRRRRRSGPARAGAAASGTAAARARKRLVVHLPLREIQARLPAKEAAVRPIRAPRDALEGVGEYVDRAEALHFLSDNCGIASQWLADIVNLVEGAAIGAGPVGVLGEVAPQLLLPLPTLFPGGSNRRVGPSGGGGGGERGRVGLPSRSHFQWSDLGKAASPSMRPSPATKSTGTSGR